MWKRISAFLFDGILLSIVIVLCALVLSWALGFDGYIDTLNACYARYEESYGVTFNLSLAEYEALSEEALARLETAHSALASDGDAVYAYNMLVRLALVITSIGILLGCAALEFVVPLLLGNGQTLGKKIFGIALMSTEGVRLSTVALFIRTFLGKYTIELMIPVLILIMIFFGSIGIVGPIVLGLIGLVQLILLIASHTNSVIHDFLANTVAVDMASQMIFSSREELIAYKEKVHAEAVARQPY